jgi:uncharacterized protein YeaO (DUF488 family)
MPVRFEKSTNDPVQPRKDGLRIVATRFWPRGLKREAANLYLPDLAPSERLLRAAQGGRITWREFATRYRQEMKTQKSHLRTLHWLSERGDTLTVLCTCEDPETCHRRLLASLIERGA